MEEFMYRVTLSLADFASIRKESTTCPDPRIIKKLHGILLVAQNVERSIVCKHLGITRHTLLFYVRLFLAEGLEGLKRNNDVPQLRPSTTIRHTRSTMA